MATNLDVSWTKVITPGWTRIINLMKKEIPRNNLNCLKNILKSNVLHLRPVIKCWTTEENALTTSSVSREIVMKTPRPAKVERKEILAMITAYVTEAMHVDQVLSGLTKLSVYLWETWTLGVRLITIASQEISAGGNWILTIKKTQIMKITYTLLRYALKSMYPLIIPSFGGILTSSLKNISTAKKLFIATEATANLV